MYKYCGDLVKAAEAAEEARLINKRERYFNCKAAKYYLRIGKFSEANARIVLFGIDKATGSYQGQILE